MIIFLITQVSFLLSIYFIKVTKKVAWPPKEEYDNPKVNDGMGEIISSAAKKYVRNVESTQSEQHGQYTLSRGKPLLHQLRKQSANYMDKIYNIPQE